MYYIFKLAESWSIMEEKTGKSKSLEKSEVDTLRALFPNLVHESTTLLLAFQISLIPSNKLFKLEIPAPGALPKKLPESTKTTV